MRRGELTTKSVARPFGDWIKTHGINTCQGEVPHFDILVFRNQCNFQIYLHMPCIYFVDDVWLFVESWYECTIRELLWVGRPNSSSQIHTPSLTHSLTRSLARIQRHLVITRGLIWGHKLHQIDSKRPICEGTSYTKYQIHNKRPYLKAQNPPNR